MQRKMNDDRPSETDHILSDANLALIVRRFSLGAGLRFIGFLIQRSLTLVKMAVFARVFAPESIGQLALLTSIVTFVGGLSNIGSRESVIRDQSGDKDRLNTNFTLSIVISLILTVGLIFVTPFLGKIIGSRFQSNWLIPLSIVILSVPAMFPTYIWERDLKLGRVGAPGIINEFCSLGATLIIMIITGNPLPSLIWGHIAGFIISIGWIWLSSREKPKLHLTRSEVKPLLSFGLPIAFDTVNYRVTQGGDNLIVGWLWGDAALGFYNVAWNLPNAISSFFGVFDFMVLPLFAQTNGDTGRLREIFNYTNKLIAVVGFPLGCALALYADPIVRVIYGPNWEPAIPILQLMAISFAFRFASGFSYGPLAIVRGRTLYLMKWGVVNSIFVILLGIILISNLGPIGGAWLWVIQLVILGPLVRFPLIIQELGTLEYLKSLSPPILSGLVASLGTAILLFTATLDTRVYIISIVLFLVLYFTSLLLLDSELVEFLRKIRQIIITQRNSTKIGF